MDSDLDELLARQLAEQDRQAAQHMLRGAQGGEIQIVRSIEDAIIKCRGYEDDLAQAMSLSVVPADELQHQAAEAVALSRAMGEEPVLAEQDALAAALLHWFKTTFFSWVNEVPCGTCGVADTRMVGMRGPTLEEAASLAGRVEVYQCRVCHAHTPFPRYNDPVKLLETRRGRCGEWANCFALVCSALQLDVRLVQDTADHVWVEYFSNAQQRWVHMDPCEASFDQPLLYYHGWRKPLALVLADCWTKVQARRTLVTEGWLTSYIDSVNQRLRAELTPEQQQLLEERDAAERQQLVAGTSATAADLALPGRQTGDVAWRAARGEVGSAQVARQHAGTRYRWAKDEGLKQINAERVCGGAVRASGDNPPSEGCERACDGKEDTKWLDFRGTQLFTSWIEYRLPASRPPATLTCYSLMSANDAPERDPRHIVMEAWSDAEARWVVLDEQPDLGFPSRHAVLAFHVQVSRQLPARAWRLSIVSVADPAAANSVQLACWDLFAAGPPQAEGKHEVDPAKEAARAMVESTAAGTPAAAATMAAVAPVTANPWSDLFSPTTDGQS